MEKLRALKFSFIRREVTFIQRSFNTQSTMVGQQQEKGVLYLEYPSLGVFLLLMVPHYDVL